MINDITDPVCLLGVFYMFQCIKALLEGEILQPFNIKKKKTSVKRFSVQLWGT